MALLATQSVNVLQASSLKETWKSVFSNFGAKIYMRLVDNETAEEATKLAGESDWKVMSRGSSQGKDGTSSSSNRELRERKNLPSSILTHVLKRGQAVVIGSLDGGSTLPGTYFMQVPWNPRAVRQTRVKPA
jgi:type IV secretory pathway TraG/TraD family ATPase VirD4